jgi:hypothetical protein
MKFRHAGVAISWDHFVPQRGVKIELDKGYERIYRCNTGKMILPSTTAKGW